MTKWTVGVLMLSVPVLSSSAFADDMVGLTAKGELIVDCALLVNTTDLTDKLPRFARVETKKFHLREVGKLYVDKTKVPTSARFEPESAVLPDGTPPTFKLTPLYFPIEVNPHGALRVLSGENCGASHA